MSDLVKPEDKVLVRMRSVWGDVFEIAVKRGILAFLVERQFVSPDHPSLENWRKIKVKRIEAHCLEQSEAIDENAMTAIRSYCNHLLTVGFGIGWTTIRRYMQSLPVRSQFKLGRLWCPLDLKDRRPEFLEYDEEMAEEAFSKAFGLSDVPRLAKRGWPARADFLMTLEVPKATRVLCVEFSLNVPPEHGDFTKPQTHREEISRYVGMVGARGVFSNIAAEVDDLEGRLPISKDVVEHMGAFTGSDKPLYKLMQGCSYGERLAKVLDRTKKMDVDVIAMTGAGVESVSAPFGPGTEGSVKRRMMEVMGEVYRDSKKFNSDDVSFKDRLDAVYMQIRKGLQPQFKKQFDSFLADVGVGRVQEVSVSEEMLDFKNPNATVSDEELGQWLAGMDDDEEASAFLGLAPTEAIKAELDDKVTLRNFNAAATKAAVRSTRPGQMKVIGLLGHPGIGKTTSVINLFSKSAGSGVFFGYFSPRVVINGDVTDKIVKNCGEGSFAVTTNHHLISIAPEWAARNGVKKEVTGAVTVEAKKGVVTRPYEDGGILHLTKDHARDASEGNYSKKDRKSDIDTRTLEMQSVRTPGVLKTLATETGWLIRENPQAPVVAVTAAIQGFRMTGGKKTTVDALKGMFRNRADTPAGIAERREFAKNRPLIVIMIDEITGDGAGAPMVHAVSEWLRSEFIAPFDDKSPFRVVLILADASLATPETISSYMDSTGKSLARSDQFEDAPPRVMVSPALREVPFGIKAGRINLNSMGEDVLYVMADAYPARRLHVDYRIRLDQVDMRDALDGEGRKREREEHGDRMANAAVGAIMDALDRHPELQVVYFAQDKSFLEGVRGKLIDQGLDMERVKTLHSSIDPEKRRILVSEEVRDEVDAFLMTSAGSRGVSFPKAATIIIQVPRFEIENSLMEIGQMIFRGRGSYKVDGKEISGDDYDRRIVFMIEDYVRTDGEGRLDLVHWASRKVDLASLVVLLRATVETRIKGYSSSPGFKGAVIPVGRVGLDVTSDTLSTRVAKLVTECRVAASDRGANVKGAAKLIETAVAELYGNFSIVGRKAGMTSFTDALTTERFSGKVCFPSATLVGEVGKNAVIPDKVHFCGPCILESWDDVDEILESFNHGVDSTEKRRSLSRLCYAVAEDLSNPKSLRDAAFGVAQMAQRTNDDLEEMEFSVRKKVQSKDVWIAVPADWTRFVTDRTGARDGRARKLPGADLWLDTMRQAISLYRNPTALMPIIPNFDDKPFAAAITFGDPTGMEVSFDSRYFMSTAEFNLLNVLLHAE